MFGVPVLLTAVRMHCDACGSHTEIVGPALQSLAAGWLTSHYLPCVDEMDVASTDGTDLFTWRRLPDREDHP